MKPAHKYNPMLFAAKKKFLPGSFDGAGLFSPAPSKGTPQETFVAQTLRAEVILILSSVAQLLKGFQPNIELSRLPQNQNASQQRRLYL